MDKELIEEVAKALFLREQQNLIAEYKKSPPELDCGQFNILEWDELTNNNKGYWEEFALIAIPIIRKAVEEDAYSRGFGNGERQARLAVSEKIKKELEDIDLNKNVIGSPRMLIHKSSWNAYWEGD